MAIKATQFRPLSFMPTASVILKFTHERQTKKQQLFTRILFDIRRNHHLDLFAF